MGQEKGCTIELGGYGGIRTHEPRERLERFTVACIQPLCHVSVERRSCLPRPEPIRIASLGGSGLSVLARAAGRREQRRLWTLLVIPILLTFSA